MKGNILTGFLVFSSLARIAAQELGQDAVSFPRRFVDKIEIMAGPSLLYPATYYRSPHQKQEIRLGFTAGLGMIHPIGKRIDLNARIGWERKRYRNTINEDVGTNYRRVTGDVRNDYWTLSLLLGYSLSKKENFKISAGGYFNILQKSETTMVLHDFVNGIFSYTTNSTGDTYKKYDAGISLSLSYHIPSRKKYAFTVRLLESNGILSINRDTVPSVLALSRNNSVALLVGVTLNR